MGSSYQRKTSVDYLKEKVLELPPESVKVNGLIVKFRRLDLTIPLRSCSHNASDLMEYARNLKAMLYF